MRLNPYLSFEGNCKEAFQFYAKTLGTEIVMMMTYADTPMAAQATPEVREKIAHAQLRVGEVVLMGSDSPHGSYTKPQGFHVTLGIDAPAEAERIFNVLAEQGSVQMPLAETFWAWRFGMLVDRFGIPWMVNCEKPQGEWSK